MKSLKLFLGILLLCAFLSTTASGAFIIPQRDCCFQIWAAGCNLGWATSLMFYTKVRERWVPADQTIYNFIIRGGEQIRIANRQCGKYPQAWSGWQNLRGRLQRTAESFSKRPNSKNRNQIWNYLRSTYLWGNHLRIAIVGRKIRTATCSEKYFKLGWFIAYTQQTLKIADETLRRGRPGWVNQVRDAKKHMSRADGVLYEWERLKPITGRCVRIKDIPARRKLSELRSLRITPDNLNYMIRTMDWLWLSMQTRILNDCSFLNTRIPPVNSSPPSNTRKHPTTSSSPPSNTRKPPTTSSSHPSIRSVAGFWKMGEIGKDPMCNINLRTDRGKHGYKRGSSFRICSPGFSFWKLTGNFLQFIRYRSYMGGPIEICASFHLVRKNYWEGVGTIRAKHGKPARKVRLYITK